MRNPRRWRNIALAFLVAGPVAVMAVTRLPKGAVDETLLLICVLVGVFSALLGALVALDAHLELRAEAALQQREDVLAHWHIDASAWRAFIALNEELNRAADAYPNELSIREEIPAQGIEVVVGKSAAQIDGGIYRLSTRFALAISRAEFKENSGRPSYVQLDLYYPSGLKVDARRACLRFPVAPDAQRDAERVVAYYRGNLPGKFVLFGRRGA
jgi:hypothetical protein